MSIEQTVKQSAADVGGGEQFIIFPNPDQNFPALSNTLEKQWMKTAMKLECFYRKNFVILSEN